MSARRAIQHAWAALPARDRRAVVIGAAMLLPALVGAFVVRPYARALGAARAELTAQRDLLARERGLLLAPVPRPMSTAPATDAASLFRGADELEATAELATYVAELAEEHGLTVGQLETAAGEDAGAGVRALRVELRAAGGVLAVLELLAAFEEGEPLVRVAALSLERAGGADGGATLALGASIVGYAALGEEE
jgi:type II secretory pathway component PulM